jgi:acyl carrier protein phosphodiesterase
VNYLAHFLLAQPRPGWVVGALLGDFHKGPLRGELPEELEQGVFLHRRIDSCSDQLPRLQRYRLGLPATWRRFSGAVLDLLFDQQLARKWSSFHDEPLEHFAITVDEVLAAHPQWLYGASQRFARRLAQHRLLPAYRDDKVIEASVQAVARRSRYGEQVLAAFDGLRCRPEEVTRLFAECFPQIIKTADGIKSGFGPEPVESL